MNKKLMLDLLDERSNMKDASVAYLSWFVLGVLGSHFYYLGQHNRGALRVLLFVVTAFIVPWLGSSLIDFLQEIGLVSGRSGIMAEAIKNGLPMSVAVSGVVWVLDGLKLGSIVDEHNRKVRAKIALQMEELSIEEKSTSDLEDAKLMNAGIPDVAGQKPRSERS
ncbi:MAG: hypothetical protein Alpg2KO_28990 [Alphaproteobacteria bacterium]